MRKWYVIVMAAFGMTLFMLLGPYDLSFESEPNPDGAAVAPEPGSPDEAAAPRTALQAVVSMEPQAFEALRRATERFESLRPNVAVTLANVKADELRIRVRVSTDTGEAPDILLYPTEWVRREAAEGRLLSLDDYVPAERQSQWFETVRGAVRWNGYLWGVPVEWDPYVIVYRSDASPIAESDQAAPPTASTWLALDGEAAKEEDREPTYDEALLAQWSKPDEREEESGESGKDREAEIAEVSEEIDKPEDEPPAAAEPTALQASSETAEGPVRGTVEQVARGEAAWSLAPLSDALAAAGEPASGLSAMAFVPDEEAAGGLPPFEGSSFVVSPSTLHPAEAADWIRFVTDAETAEAFGTFAGTRWPVSRSSFGLPSFPSGTPAMLAAGTGSVVAVLPDAEGLDEQETLNALRPLMRTIDGLGASYGPPPEALPPPVGAP